MDRGKLFMQNKIEVNIDKDPYFKAYVDMSFSYSIIRKDHVSFDNWMLSNMTQLCCSDKYDINFIKPTSYKSINLLDTIELHYGVIDSEKTFHKYIIEFLQNGYCLIIDIDGFYIPNRRAYGKHHNFIHANVIYGYTYEINSYMVFGYNETGHLQGNEVPASDIYKAYMTKLGVVPLFFLKQNSCDYKIDWYKFSTDLKNYCSGSPGYDLFRKDRVYGVNAMRMMIKVLDKMKTGEHRVDLRLLTLVYEHKKLMEHKVKILLEKGLRFKYSNIMDKLEENKKDADFCRVMLIKYSLQKKENQIDFIQEKLEKIIKIEDVVFPIISEEVEKYKRHLMERFS